MKRKVIIDQTIVARYKALAGDGGAPAKVLPETAGDGRKRGSYYIYTNTGIKALTGWIMTIDGLKVGCSRVGCPKTGYWSVTDIVSGCAITSASKLDDVPARVSSFVPLVTAKRQDPEDKYFRKMEREIAAAYADAPI